MGFTGWPMSAIDFYDGLDENNSKTYWHEHKAVYEEAVRGPMRELLADLEPALGPAKIFRPNRDIRFSHDKTPYKTNVGALIGDCYVQLSSAGLAAGRGMWHMESDQLERYRKAVDDDASGTDLEALVRTARRAGITVMSRDELKTAPRGYPKDHPRIELLRFKGLVTWQEWPVAAWLHTAKAKDRIMKFLQLAEPIAAWLEREVGPSAMPSRHRG